MSTSRKLEKHFLGMKVQHIPREANGEADDIAKCASRREAQKPGVFEERLLKPSAVPLAAVSGPPREEAPPVPPSGAPGCGLPSGSRLLLALEPQEDSWIDELKAYMLRGDLPTKEAEAERVVRQSSAYCLHNGDLYQRRANDVFLRCISERQGRDLLADIHGGDIGHHSSSHTLAGKVFRSGFYWPTVLRDATELVRSREAC